MAEPVQDKIPAAGERIEMQCRILTGPSSPEPPWEFYLIKMFG